MMCVFYISLSTTQKNIFILPQWVWHSGCAVLLFSLPTAPQAFTKYMAVMAAYLHKRITGWLAASSCICADNNLWTTLQLLDQLRWTVNVKKPYFNSVQLLRFMGTVQDSVVAWAFCHIARRWISLGTGSKLAGTFLMSQTWNYIEVAILVSIPTRYTQGVSGFHPYHQSKAIQLMMDNVSWLCYINREELTGKSIKDVPLGILRV